MMLRDMYLGTSIAVSWAWGTSLILGMQIAQTKGIEAFLLWAIANSATLGIFGILYKKRVLFDAVLDQKVIRVFTNLIQCFCLIIQLKILNETLGQFFSPLASYAMTVAFASGLTLWMYAKGLMASIFTDLFQGLFTGCVLVGMLGLCFWQGQLPTHVSHSGVSDISWGVWSACILLSGIMTDLQHWQRAKVNGDGKAFEWASAFFAGYLALVYALSRYELSGPLSVMLLLAVIGVTISTVDSIAVALHRDFGRKLGTAVALAICFGFGLLIKLSVLSIWSYFGAIRVGLALYILHWCITHKRSRWSLA